MQREVLGMPQTISPTVLAGQDKVAYIVGISGAWKMVVAEGTRLGATLRTPDDVGSQLADLETEYEPSIRRKRSEVAKEIDAVRSRIRDLRAETRLFWRVANWFRIHSSEIRVDQLHSGIDRHIEVLDARIHGLRDLLASPEYVGARAELEVEAQLRWLSDDFTVFNDLRLESDRYIHFGGSPIQSAQIDHLILGPSGIFVIETKRWGKRFIESGDYHDPFDQIQRAGYLCFDLVRQNFRRIPVRQIIASTGALPNPPDDAYVKLLRPQQLVGYISWFKKEEIKSGDMARLRRFLEKRVQN